MFFMSRWGEWLQAYFGLVGVCEIFLWVSGDG